MALTKISRGLLDTGISDSSDATAITISSDENVGIGGTPVSTFSGYDGAALHIQQSGTGSSVGSQVRLSSGSSGHAAGDGSYMAHWGDSNLYIANQENANILFYTNGSERMRIGNDGRVFIGSSSAVGTADISYLGPAGSDTTLQVMCPDNTPGREIQLRLTNNNSTYYGYGAAFRSVQGGGINSYTLYVETNATGGVYLSGGGTSWSSVSDERHKTIIEDIDNASQKVSTLRTVIGSFNDDPDSKRRPFLIAQDVQAVLPEAVDDTANPDKLGLSYTDVIPLLTAAIKEQKAIIDDLKTRIETLENA